MDPIIFTPRLKLSLITTVDTGSPELEWLHEIRTDEEAMFWRYALVELIRFVSTISTMMRLICSSLGGVSKSVEETQEKSRRVLFTHDVDQKVWKVTYLVHRILESPSDGGSPLEDRRDPPTEFIGVVNVGSLGPYSLDLPEHLTIPASATDTTLILETGYYFLPKGWGKGYATEAVNAMFDAAQKAPSFWAPFTKVYVRALVNSANPRSKRVMAKTGMVEIGVLEWSGDPVFIAGEWRDHDSLHIFNRYLLE
jgi:RimJ/RimL family protein N-acetyltransferase